MGPFTIIAPDMVSETDELSRLLRAHGLRPTWPRLAVLSFLKGRGEHLTPAEIFHGLRASGQAVSIATLYQNLQALSQRGLIKRIVGPDGAVRYDVNLAPHHHLVCQRCGRLVDVELSEPLTVQPVVAPHHGPLRAEDGQTVGGRIEPQEHPESTLAGWQVLAAQVEFQGLCPQCARLPRTAQRRGRSE